MWNTTPRRGLDPRQWRRHASEAHATSTKELIEAHTGVVVDCTDPTHRLAFGDAISFAGDVTHAYRNDGPRSHQALVIAADDLVAHLSPCWPAVRVARRVISARARTAATSKED